MNEIRRKRVLFLCNHNSSRSIMAEALVNHYLGDKWEAFSAGADPTSVNPFSIIALRELGIEIPQARSKRTDFFRGWRFDRIFTLCDEAREACPLWLGPDKVEHFTFPDPTAVPENEKLGAFRDVRDRIREGILPLLSI
jgi:arsenate reductase (thioredoxin)